MLLRGTGPKTLVVAAICVAMLVDSLLYSVVVPVLPGYASQLGASSAAIGLLFAAYAIGLVLATPVLGRLSDRIGRRVPILLGSLGLVVTTVLYTFADSYPTLVTARFMQGIAAAAVWTAGVALVADLTPPEKLGRVMGVVLACMSAGLVLGPPIGGVLEQIGGYRTPFLVVAGAALVSGLAQLVLIKDPPRRGTGNAPLGTLLRDPALRGTVIAVFLGASALSLLEPILPLELSDRGVGPASVGLIFGVATLANGIASPLIGAMADRFRGGRLIGIGLVVSGGVLPGLLIPDTVLGVAAVLVVFAIAYGFVLVPTLPELAAVSERHGGGAHATVYAAFNISYSMGMVLGPVAGGAGAGISLNGTLAAAGAVLCASGALLLVGTIGGTDQKGRTMTKARLAVRALRLAITRSVSDPIQDYNAASPDYDSFFTRVMGGHSVAALDHITVKPGGTVVELACGTGHLTAAVGERLAGRGVIRAVDKSPGMLEVARAKVRATSELDIGFELGDMEQFLRSQPDASADVVVCGWAICYGKPTHLLKQIHRVLKPGGEVLIVETRADALDTLVRPLERVFADDPSLLTALIRVALPKSARVVARWFEKAGLTVTHTGEGAQVLPVATPDAALEWVQRSGAAAGFKDAVDSSREAEVLRRLRDELGAQAARTGTVELRHTFVVVAGFRPVTAT